MSEAGEGLSGLLQASRVALGLAGFSRQEQVPDLASAAHVLPSGTVSIDTWIHSHVEGHEARLALIRSPKIEIITAFLYPAAGIVAPLYAMELVRLGTRPVVAVMDCVAPAMDPCMPGAVALLEATRAEAPDLIAADDPPDWYAEARSGADLFYRPVDGAALHRAGLLHLRLWSALLLSINRAALRSGRDADAFVSFARDYKDHHRRHSPGIPLMTRCFGAEWTARYLTECFFR